MGGMDIIVGLAVFALLGFIWDQMSRSVVGRVLQAIFIAIAYAIWLSIIPLGIYAIGRAIFEAVGREAYGQAAFIAAVSLTFIPMFVIALLPWNYFCRYVWRKAGVRLPQTHRLAGTRQYFEWERER